LRASHFVSIGALCLSFSGLARLVVQRRDAPTISGIDRLYKLFQSTVTCNTP